MKQIQRPTARSYAESEKDNKTHNSRWVVSIETFISEFRKPSGSGGRKSVRTSEDGGHQENKVL